MYLHIKNEEKRIIVTDFYKELAKYRNHILKHQCKENIELLKELLNGHKIIDIDSYVKENPYVVDLLTKGIVFLLMDGLDYGTYKLVLPKDIINLFQPILNDPISIKNNKQANLFCTYLDAFLNLYGAIETTCFLDVWNERNKEYQLTIEELYSEIKELKGYHQHLNLAAYGKIIYNDLSMEGAEAVNLVHSTREHNYYAPTIEDIVYFSTNEFDTRTPYYDEMKEFISNYTSTMGVEVIMDNFMTDVTTGSHLCIGERLNELEEFYDINFLSLTAEREFDHLYTNLYYNSPKWVLRGNKLNNLSRKIRERFTSHKSDCPYTRTFPDHNKKIAVEWLNKGSLCPCGSGVEYEECHGI